LRKFLRWIAGPLCRTTAFRRHCSEIQKKSRQPIIIKSN
jgi:hypothetical protein